MITITGPPQSEVSVHEHAALMGRRGYDNKRGHMDINDRDRVGSIGSDLMDHSGNDRLDSRDSGYESGGGGRYVDDRSRGHRIGSVTEGTESVRMPDSMPGAADAEGIQEAMQWFVRAQVRGSCWSGYDTGQGQGLWDGGSLGWSTRCSAKPGHEGN